MGDTAKRIKRAGAKEVEPEESAQAGAGQATSGEEDAIVNFQSRGRTTAGRAFHMLRLTLDHPQNFVCLKAG